MAPFAAFLLSLSGAGAVRTVLREQALRSPPQIEGFRLESFLGKGSLGDTWKAWDLGSDRHVALKLLHGDAGYVSRATASGADALLLERGSQGCRAVQGIFERAQRLPGRERHWAQHICRCLADRTGDEEGPAFLVYEFCGLPAEDVLDSLRGDRTLLEDGVRLVVAGLARGIAVLSSLDPPVSHRNLNLDSVLVTTGVQAKITGWEAAREASAAFAPSADMQQVYVPPAALNGTATSQPPGKPWYWDMYAAGVIYYELLTPKAFHQESILKLGSGPVEEAPALDLWAISHMVHGLVRPLELVERLAEGD